MESSIYEDYKQPERGLRVIGFFDRNGQECTLMESSLAEQPAIRIGVNEEAYLHIHMDLLIELMPYINNFIKTGQL